MPIDGRQCRALLRGRMTTSCSLRMLLLVSLLTGPSTCRGNFVQHAITDVLSWARHELAAWTHSAAPLSEGFGPQCIDAQGHAVEWWVAVKPPSTTDLLYVDSRTPEADPTQWRFSVVSGESATPVERTLQQLQGSSGERAFGHVMYSDDAPQPDGVPAADSPDAVFTQGRGVLGFGTSRGFWITHSLPRFPMPPDISSPAGYPSRARPHAHSLLCISAAAGQLRSLAGTLRSSRYDVYSRALPSDTRGWSAEDLIAAAELLLEDPADSADGDDNTEPDVVMNEISAIKGERFVVLGNNGSRSEIDIVDGILGSFYGTPMLRSSQYWPRPCAASKSGYPNFQPRDLLEEANGRAWNASLERSHWQISFSEGQAPVRCQGELWDPDMDAEAGEVPVALPEEEGISSDMRWVLGPQHAAMSARDEAEVAAEGHPFQTMTVPVTSASRRLLLDRRDDERDSLDTPGRTLSEFIAYGTGSVSRPLTSLARQLAHRLLGSPEMAAELAMRRSMLSVPGAGPAQPQSAGSAGQAEVRRSFLDWLPASVWPLFEILRGRQPDGEEQALYQPRDDSYFSAASELLDMRNKAIKEQLVWDKGQSSDQEIRQGLSTESRLTGATSNSPDQSQQAGWGTLLQRQEAGEHEQEDCSGALSPTEELKCRARSLQQQARTLERRVDRLEEAAEGESVETEQLPGEDARMGRPFAGYSLRERWEEAETVQTGEASGCARAAGNEFVPEEKHTVCFRDRGRSLEAGGLPGGAVCFGRHEGLWHALRALVRMYEYCA